VCLDGPAPDASSEPVAQPKCLAAEATGGRLTTMTLAMLSGHALPATAGMGTLIVECLRSKSFSLYTWSF
jgi:hypothetical protein